MSRALAVGLALAIAAGCGSTESASPGTTATSTATSTAASQALPVGKSDLTVAAGVHEAPEGFAPALSFELEQTATSVHRASDAFDLALSAASGDAPLAILVLATPAESDAIAAAQAIKDAATTAGAAVTDAGAIEVLGRPATVIEVRGGTGQVFASRDHTIALDADSAPFERFLVVDTEAGPLVIAALVPDGAPADVALANAGVVVRSLSQL